MGGPARFCSNQWYYLYFKNTFLISLLIFGGALEGTFEIEGVMKTEIGPDDHLIIKLGGKYLKKRNGVEVQEKAG